MLEGRQVRAFAEVQAELTHERARVLGRAGSQVEHHLDRCRELETLLARVDDRDSFEDLMTEYRQARQAFDRTLWAYCVHREAIGLHDHRWVHRTYVTPPSVADLRARWVHAAADSRPEPT